MDASTAYALFPDALTTPHEHRTLAALVRQIHRARRGASIELVADDLTLTDGRELKIVSVYRLDDGSRSALLGHAYLRGGGRQALSRALAAARPDRGPSRADPASTPCLAAH